MPTYRTGDYATYNQSVGVRIDMDEAVSFLTPTDVPLQDWLGTPGTTNVTKVEWLEDDLISYKVTASARSGSTPDWTLTVPDTSHLRVGDVIFTSDGLDSTKQWYVSSVTDATHFVASVFPIGSHTTAPGSTDTFEVIGQIPTEGADPGEMRSVERTSKYNVTQIFQEKVEATRTARGRGQRGGLYGMGDPYDYELQKKFAELAIRFERSCIHGQRWVSSDSKKRMMGGFFYFITTTTTSGVKANIRTLANDALRKAYEAGGEGELYLMTSPTVKSIISDIDNTSRRTTRDDKAAGYVVDTFESDFGTVKIVPNRHLPKTRGLVLRQGWNSLVNFDPWFHEMLAKTGDADVGEIVGEKTLVVKNEVGQGLFTVTDA